MWRPALLFLLAAGAFGAVPAAAAEAPRDVFFERLAALCGQAFEGRIVSPPVEADRDFAGRRLAMQVRDCSENEIRIPFRVGADSSRTWVIRRQRELRHPFRVPAALAIGHDHRHEDGSADRLSGYGGVTVAEGTETRQEFPADRFSRELFESEGLSASTTNVWAVEVHPGRLFAYELRRPGRFFRVEFDLSRALELPADDGSN